MADKSDIYVKVPDGSYIRFPAGTSNEVMSHVIRGQMATAAPPMPSPKLAMKESMAPKLVRAASNLLPATGGIAGGIIGAPAGGFGAPVGAALGAMAGESGREAINEGIFGDKSPAMKERLKNTGGAGALAGLSEGAGGLAIGFGNRIVSRLATAKSTKEVGDVVEALMQERPVGFSPKAILADLETASRKLSGDLGKVFRGTSATTPVQGITNNAYAQAQQAAQTTPLLRSVPARFERIIQAAKINAGIRGNTATPQQLFNFMRELGREAYAGNPGPSSMLLKNLMKKAYSDAGQVLRGVAPDADPVLNQLTNLHAASDAITHYGLSKTESTAMTAALHPRTTAAISPVATVAGVAGYEKAKDLARQLTTQRFIP